MSILAGITAAKASLELTTKVMDLLNRPQVDVVDVKAKVHEMLIHLVNAQVALGEAHVEISDLRNQLNEREAWKALNDDMDFRVDGGFFVRKSEISKGLIAYCPVCWKVDNKTVPMQTSGTPGWFRCTVHNNVYKTEGCRTEDKVRAEAARQSQRGGSDSWLNR